MCWDAYLIGELEFPKGQIAKWKKALVDPHEFDDLPPWLAPPLWCAFPVGRVLTELTHWNESWRSYLGTSDNMEVISKPAGVRFRGYLTGFYFRSVAGAAAAIVRMAAQFGATGRLLIVEVSSSKGIEIVLSDGLAKWMDLDLASNEDAREVAQEVVDWLRETGLPLPDAGQKDPERGSETFRSCTHRPYRPPRPFQAIHDDAGGVLEEPNVSAMPTHYGKTPEEEAAQARADYGVFDLSHKPYIRLAGKFNEFLSVITDKPVEVGIGETQWIDICNAHHVLISRVLASRGVNDQYWLHFRGSEGAALELYHWLRLHKLTTFRGKDIRIEVPSMFSGMWAWVGPNARARIAAHEIGELTPHWGMVQVDLYGQEAAIVTATEPALNTVGKRELDHLCGWEAAEILRKQSGEVRPNVDAPVRPVL